MVFVVSDKETCQKMNVRAYRFEKGWRWCSKCEIWLTPETFVKTNPFCPLCKAIKMRTRPRS